MGVYKVSGKDFWFVSCIAVYLVNMKIYVGQNECEEIVLFGGLSVKLNIFHDDNKRYLKCDVRKSRPADEALVLDLHTALSLAFLLDGIAIMINDTIYVIEKTDLDMMMGASCGSLPKSDLISHLAISTQKTILSRIPGSNLCDHLQETAFSMIESGARFIRQESMVSGRLLTFCGALDVEKIFNLISEDNRPSIIKIPLVHQKGEAPHQAIKCQEHHTIIQWPVTEIRSDLDPILQALNQIIFLRNGSFVTVTVGETCNPFAQFKLKYNLDVEAVIVGSSKLGPANDLDGSQRQKMRNRGWWENGASDWSRTLKSYPSRAEQQQLVEGTIGALREVYGASGQIILEVSLTEPTLEDVQHPSGPYQLDPDVVFVIMVSLLVALMMISVAFLPWHA